MRYLVKPFLAIIGALYIVYKSVATVVMFILTFLWGLDVSESVKLCKEMWIVFYSDRRLQVYFATYRDFIYWNWKRIEIKRRRR